MARITNAGDNGKIIVIGRDAIDREFGTEIPVRVREPPPRRPSVFWFALTLGLITGFAIGELFAKALPTPLMEALEIVIDILDTEYDRAINQQRSNRAQGQPNNQLCENIVRDLVKKIRDRTIAKVNEKIKELQGRKPAEYQPCREPTLAIAPRTPSEWMSHER